MHSLYKICFFVFFTYKSMAQVSILPVFGDKPITEDTWFNTKKGESIQFDNIRFYLSNIEFVREDKSVIKDTATAHLIDVFEPNTLKIDLQKIDFSQVKTMRFNIGIDSSTNVSGALGGDLDPQKGMYWAWQSGYINMKIEGRSPQCKSRKNVFQYHIGGYLQPNYSIRSVELPVNAQNTEGGTNPKSDITNPKYTEGVSSPKSDITNPKYTEGVSSPKSDITNPKYTEGVVLRIDFSKFFEQINIAQQNSIMMPCSEAMQLAGYSVNMFSIPTHEK
jgi:hypothetical protein